ncbi:hypothetical protein R83H12_02553 [Fibrobacteria bacterium R8-3-H12]
MKIELKTHIEAKYREFQYSNDSGMIPPDCPDEETIYYKSKVKFTVFIESELTTKEQFALRSLFEDFYRKRFQLQKNEEDI